MSYAEHTSVILISIIVTFFIQLFKMFHCLDNISILGTIIL